MPIQDDLQFPLENRFTDEITLKALAESNDPLIISLTNDYAFKTTFRNKLALRGLLGALLEIHPEEITELEFQDSFLYRDFPEDKEGILDVKLLLNHSKKVNIEIQVLPFLNWEERSLFYLSRHFTEGFQKGSAYGQLETTIHISILSYTLCEEDGLYSIIELRERSTHRLYSDKMSLRMLQLKKLKDVTEAEKHSDIYKWASMISAKDWEVLKSMAENNEYMKEAVTEMEKINGEKSKRLLYLQHEKRVRDEAAMRGYALHEGWERGLREGLDEGWHKGLDEGLRKGHDEGLRKGLDEGLRKGHDEGLRKGLEQSLTILKLLQSGLSPEDIAAQTGCSSDLILSIQQELLN